MVFCPTIFTHKPHNWKMLTPVVVAYTKIAIVKNKLWNSKFSLMLFSSYHFFFSNICGFYYNLSEPWFIQEVCLYFSNFCGIEAKSNKQAAMSALLKEKQRYTLFSWLYIATILFENRIGKKGNAKLNDN